MGYRIKEIRLELNMTQQELSRKSGVPKAIISGLESGRITVTTTDTLLKLANALGKKVSEFFFEMKV